MIFSLLVSFAVTIFAELTVALILGLRRKVQLFLVFLANVITNPLTVYIVNLLHCYGNVAAEYTVLGFLEIAAVVTEALIYRYALGWSPKKALLFSMLLNAASFLLGMTVQFILKWV